MRLIRKTIRLIFSAIHLTWGTFMMAFLVGPNPNRRTERDWRFIMNWMKFACKIVGMRFHITGTPPKEPCLLASNHISWYDILVLQSLISTGFIAKSEIRNWPLIGWLAYRANTLFIHRGKRDSAQQIKDEMQPRLANQQTIMVFPEGTTSIGDTVLRFRSRLFEAATELHVPIQPIALYYTGHNRTCAELAFVDKESFASHILRTLDEPHINVYIHFCPLINTEKDSARRELGKQAEEAVAKALDNIKASIVESDSHKQLQESL